MKKTKRYIIFGIFVLANIIDALYYLTPVSKVDSINNPWTIATLIFDLGVFMWIVISQKVSKNNQHIAFGIIALLINILYAGFYFSPNSKNTIVHTNIYCTIAILIFDLAVITGIIISKTRMKNK